MAQKGDRRLVSIKPDSWIRRMAQEQRMIEPFEPALVRGGIISFGLSSYGYDVRLADEFKVPVPGRVLDPKAVDAGAFADVQAGQIEVPPNSFILGRTVEYLRIPANVLALCLGKSSYARCGVLVNTTPFEPTWEGYPTLCIANTGARPARLYAGEGIGQVIFFESDEPCEVTYAGRAGKYQAQQSITPTRVERVE
jgi:dCTP deaminase